MITLTLLHPVQSTPVQSWTFAKEDVIRIGRAVDNHVVLYSAVVSRHHVELRRSGPLWEVVNLGTNGTYLDGKRIHQAPLADGGVIRLARSGPNIQVRMGEAQPLPAVKSQVPVPSQALSSPLENDVILNAAEREVREKPLATKEENPEGEEEEDDGPPFYVAGPHQLPTPNFWQSVSGLTAEQLRLVCSHPRAEEGLFFCLDCGQPLKVWKHLGQYQVVNLLGAGGNTFLAWRQGYTLVLKTLKFEWLDRKDGIQLFLQRAQALCQLSHPGLPKVFEAFTLAGQPFLATEMIYGPNLRQWVASHGPLSQTQAIAWALEVCEILEYLHQQTPPIVHQGVKPENLIRPMIARASQQIFLVDLGDVKLLTPEAGTFTGSIGYAAPEQQEGHPIPASDLYSLGATLVYLLSGQQPDSFYRWGPQEFRLYVEDIPRLTPEISHVIAKLTHPHPEARYVSVQALAQVLRQIA